MSHSCMKTGESGQEFRDSRAYQGVAPYFQIFDRHEFGRIGGVAKGRGDVEGGGDIGGAIKVVIAMNSEGRLVLRFTS